MKDIWNMSKPELVVKTDPETLPVTLPLSSSQRSKLEILK